MAYESIASHRTMALDAVRNRAYTRALQQVITADSIVLDLGAGTGVLGLIAARLGAKRVYLVEPTDVISVAQELVTANGLGDRVQCLHGRLETVRLPEKADVIVSVMTGNFLVTEDLLPILFRARDTVLRPGGHLIPSAAVMEATIVSSPVLHQTHVSCWSDDQQGVDTAACRPYAANTPVYNTPDIRGVEYLADPATVHRVDFARDGYEGVHVKVALRATDTGTCHGIAGWFRVQLGDAWLSTSPKDEKVHWSAVFFPIDPPLVVAQGDEITIAMDRPPDGDWTWRVKAPAGSRQHSTLFSAPLTESTVRKASKDFVPQANAAGRALRHVLESMDGTHDVTAIARSLRAAFPDQYPTETEAVAFTHETIVRYADAAAAGNARP